jgi:hypothetical protein
MRRSPTAWWLLVRATTVLALVQLGLAVLPFGRLQRLVAWAATPRRRLQRRHQPPERLVWAITTASRRVTGASCLTQSLAAQILFARHGHPAQLRIGVARDGIGKLEAHAWIESQGRVVIGEPELWKYTPLTNRETGNLLS